MPLFGRRRQPEYPTCALIVAAGVSSRMGFNKQLADVGDMPVVIRAALAFERSVHTQGIVIVTRSEDIPAIGAFVREFGLTKVTEIVAGGSTRQQSAANGARLIDPGRYRFVAVHDGARPFATPMLIDRVIEDAAAHGAAAAGIPMRDTVKRTDAAGRVLETLDREQLWRVQTPQVFETDAYRGAIAQAIRMGFEFTDDCQLFERMGLPVYITMGETTNLKITTPEDFAVAGAMLQMAEE